MKTTGTKAADVLRKPAFNNGDIDTRKPQLAREEKTGRAATGDDHRMLVHRCLGVVARAVRQRVVTPSRLGAEGSALNRRDNIASSEVFEDLEKHFLAVHELMQSISAGLGSIGNDIIIPAENEVAEPPRG